MSEKIHSFQQQQKTQREKIMWLQIFQKFYKGEIVPLGNQKCLYQLNDILRIQSTVFQPSNAWGNRNILKILLKVNMKQTDAPLQGEKSTKRPGRGSAPGSRSVQGGAARYTCPEPQRTKAPTRGEKNSE